MAHFLVFRYLCTIVALKARYLGNLNTLSYILVYRGKISRSYALRRYTAHNGVAKGSALLIYYP